MIGPGLTAVRPVFLPSPVNRHHPLTTGLQMWLYGVPELCGGRLLYDLVGPNHATLTNGPLWKPNPLDGSGLLDTNSAAGYGTIAEIATNKFAGSAYSVAFVIMTNGFAAVGGVNPRFITKNDTGGATGVIIMATGTSSPTTITMATKVASTTTAQQTTATLLSTNGFYHVLCTFDGSTRAIYVNGANQPLSSAGAPGFSASTDLRIGTRDTTAGTMNGLIGNVMKWDRWLDDNDAMGLYAEYIAGFPGLLNRLGDGYHILMGQAAIVAAAARRRNYLPLLGVGGC